MSTFGSLNERRRKYGFFGGRTLAVAVVTAVAALSFSLGYYSGRSGIEGQRAQEAVNVVPEGAGLVLLSGGDSCKETSSEGAAISLNSNSRDSLLETIKAASVPKADPGAGSPDEPVIEPLAAVAGKERAGAAADREGGLGHAPAAAPAAETTEDQDEPSQAENPARPAPVKKVDTVQKAASREAKEHPPATKASPVKKQAPAARESATDGRAYGVQVGAFKSLGDAQTHKRRFSGKGYKASVYKDRGSDGGDIFKVRIGPFTSRAEADSTARKLKDADGVNAFVTPIE